MKKRIRQGILVILTMLLASSVCFAADSEGTKLPDSAANTPAPPAFIEMDDGDYAIPVSLEGGSGKASVTTPAALKVKDGTAVMTLVWGSENYDYMISGGVKYQPSTWKSLRHSRAEGLHLFCSEVIEHPGGKEHSSIFKGSVNGIEPGEVI